MNDEVRRPGRPKKHPAEDLHFKAAQELPLAEEQVDPVLVAEDPIVLTADRDLESESELPTTEEIFAPPVIISPHDESPAEEKIHDEPLVPDINGWHAIELGGHSAGLPPLNGMPVKVTTDPQTTGITAFWKKTRAFANPTKKWELTGKWCDYLTGVPINFEPKYWRERYV